MSETIAMRIRLPNISWRMELQPIPPAMHLKTKGIVRLRQVSEGQMEQFHEQNLADSDAFSVIFDEAPESLDADLEGGDEVASTSDDSTRSAESTDVDESTSYR